MGDGVAVGVGVDLGEAVEVGNVCVGVRDGVLVGLVSAVAGIPYSVGSGWDCSETQAIPSTPVARMVSRAKAILVCIGYPLVAPDSGQLATEAIQPYEPTRGRVSTLSSHQCAVAYGNR